MQTQIVLNAPDPVDDIPNDWYTKNKLTNESLIEDDSRESTIALRKDHVRQADAVDVRETSVRAVSEAEECRLRELYKVPDGQQVTPIQRLFAGLAQDLQDIVQGSVLRKSGIMQSNSKAKSKSALARSKMLKMIMPELSRDQGEALANAIGKNDGDAVASIMTQIGRKLQKQLNEKKRK